MTDHQKEKNAICEIDAGGFWTGSAGVVDVDAGVPKGWVRLDPPSISSGERAQFSPDGVWLISQAEG